MIVSELPDLIGERHPHPFLVCRDGCPGEWSANAGDYFLLSPDHIMRCECGAPLELVRRVCTLELIAS